MSSATEREPQEYLFLPFGTYRGKPFPEVPRDFLERILTKWNSDPVNENYPGLMDSISDFLKGSGYYFGQDTEEKRKAREKAEQEQSQRNPWGPRAAHTHYSTTDPPGGSNWADFNDIFEEAKRWNQKYHQQSNTRDFEEAKRERWKYPPPFPGRKRGGINKELARQIIAAGRRALAAKHHPDKGGDTETMQEVNAAADWLETLL